MNLFHLSFINRIALLDARYWNKWDKQILFDWFLLLICCGRTLCVCVCAVTEWYWQKYSISEGRRAPFLPYIRIDFSLPWKLSDFATMLPIQSTYMLKSHQCINNTNDGNKPQAFNEEPNKIAYVYALHNCMYVNCEYLCAHSYFTHQSWSEVVCVCVEVVVFWLQLSDILVSRFHNMESIAMLSNHSLV